MADWADATQALQGYRLVTRGDKYRRYESAGASILDISRAPSSEEQVKEWWRREVCKAERDRVALAVLVSHTRFSPLQKRWLRKIEEEEWYGNDSSPGRVRTTTVAIVNRAVHTREKLTDDWGDAIERGAGEASTDSIKMPAWFKRGVCVELKSNKAKGVIRKHKVDGNIVKIVLADDNSTMSVKKDEVMLDLPRKDDRVLVIGGGYEGREGRLRHISGMQANVVLDPAGADSAPRNEGRDDGRSPRRQLQTLAYVDFVHLAKMRHFRSGN